LLLTEDRLWCGTGTSDAAGVPDDVAVLRPQIGGCGRRTSGCGCCWRTRTAKIADPATRIARLERLISRNSSMPLGLDDVPGNMPPEPRPGGRGPEAGQRAAPGAHLAWNDRPDKTIPYFPESICACGAGGGRNITG
jgi:hypothetical protein